MSSRDKSSFRSAESIPCALRLIEAIKGAVEKILIGWSDSAARKSLTPIITNTTAGCRRNTVCKRARSPEVVSPAIARFDTDLWGITPTQSPRATIESVDVSAAESMPGVVYAAALKEPGDRVRYSGDDSVLAVVAAETPEQAADALRAIRVEASSSSASRISFLL